MKYVYAAGVFASLLALLISIVGFAAGVSQYLAGAFGICSMYGGFVMAGFLENAEC